MRRGVREGAPVAFGRGGSIGGVSKRSTVGPPSLRRAALAVILVTVAGVAGYASWGVLQNLFADYREGATSTYLLLGLPLGAVSIGCLAAAGLALLRSF